MSNLAIFKQQNAVTVSGNRELSDLAKAAQSKPETKLYTMITVAQVDGVKKQPVAVEQKAKVQEAKPVVRSDELEDESPIDEPVKRQAKKAEPAPKAKANLADVLTAWSQDE